MTRPTPEGETGPPPRRPMVQLKDGLWVRRPLRVGERLSDEERDEITENIRRQAKAAGER